MSAMQIKAKREPGTTKISFQVNLGHLVDQALMKSLHNDKFQKSQIIIVEDDEGDASEATTNHVASSCVSSKVAEGKNVPSPVLPTAGASERGPDANSRVGSSKPISLVSNQTLGLKANGSEDSLTSQSPPVSGSHFSVPLKMRMKQRYKQQGAQADQLEGFGSDGPMMEGPPRSKARLSPSSSGGTAVNSMAGGELPSHTDRSGVTADEHQRSKTNPSNCTTLSMHAEDKLGTSKGFLAAFSSSALPHSKYALPAAEGDEHQKPTAARCKLTSGESGRTWPKQQKQLVPESWLKSCPPYIPEGKRGDSVKGSWEEKKHISEPGKTVLATRDRGQWDGDLAELASAAPPGNRTGSVLLHKNPEGWADSPPSSHPRFLTNFNTVVPSDHTHHGIPRNASEKASVPTAITHAGSDSARNLANSAMTSSFNDALGRSSSHGGRQRVDEGLLITNPHPFRHRVHEQQEQHTRVPDPPLVPSELHAYPPFSQGAYPHSQSLYGGRSFHPPLTTPISAPLDLSIGAGRKRQPLPVGTPAYYASTTPVLSHRDADGTSGHHSLKSGPLAASPPITSRSIPAGDPPFNSMHSFSSREALPFRTTEPMDSSAHVSTMHNGDSSQPRRVPPCATVTDNQNIPAKPMTTSKSSYNNVNSFVGTDAGRLNWNSESLPPFNSIADQPMEVPLLPFPLPFALPGDQHLAKMLQSINCDSVRSPPRVLSQEQLYNLKYKDLIGVVVEDQLIGGRSRDGSLAPPKIPHERQQGGSESHDMAHMRRVSPPDCPDRGSSFTRSGNVRQGSDGLGETTVACGSASTPKRMTSLPSATEYPSVPNSADRPNSC